MSRKIDNSADGADDSRIIRTVFQPVSGDVRLDLFLAGRFTYKSRTAWQASVRADEIILNGHHTHPSRVLHAGDVIEYRFPDLPEPPVNTDFSVLFENDSFLVCSKPAPLPVHPAGCYFRNTLLMLLKPEYGLLYPVNRLDRETSGLTLFAKKTKTAAHLAALFAGRAVEKRYLAIVHGSFPGPDPIRAAGFLFPDLDSPVRKKRKYSPFAPPYGVNAEACLTEFRLIEHAGDFSLIECRPHTGRLHQIRATLPALGFPLAGDKLYGLDDSMYLRMVSDSLTENDRARLIYPRQALHAAYLTFRLPEYAEPFEFSLPLPADLAFSFI